MVDQQEEAKRQLHKLLREYDANAGMAGFVCGKPVELMPKSEQDRLINGFCTSENLKILAVSRQKLELAKSLELDQQEAEKIERAIPTLDSLVETFSNYIDSRLSRSELRNRVRKVLDRPIPKEQDELIDALSHIVEAIVFLGEQDLSTKDDWDKMLDCSQMHDSISRALKVCEALQTESADVQKTTELLRDSLEMLEGYFKEKGNESRLQANFSNLSDELKTLWASE